MIKRRSSFLAVLLTTGALCGSGVLRAEEWPVIESPPMAEVSWVAENMIMNGVPMNIRQFTSDMSVDGVLAFYRNKWGADSELKPVENDVAEWKVIGMQSGDYYLTVQAKKGENTSSEGYLGVSKLPAMTALPALDSDFPRMEGTEVMQDMDSGDSGKRAKTLVMQNNYSVQANAQFYKSSMSRHGWEKMDNYADHKVNGSAVVYYFQRHKQDCNIVIDRNPDGGSTVVVNLVSHRG